MESMSSHSPAAASDPLRIDCVLVNTHAVAGHKRNGTTARGRTRNGRTIEVSLNLAFPPHPSSLFVHSSDMNPFVSPSIVCMVDDFILLRVSMGTEPFSVSPQQCDYFIYRADVRHLSLERLQRPHPYFKDSDVGLLPRPDGHYIVAALIPARSALEYSLHLFDSKNKSWSCSKVSVKEPQREFPVNIPVSSNSSRLLYHLTSTVITIGGEGGTMGWVDLWRGILLCNVLDKKPYLRGVPLPLPKRELSYNNGKGMKFGCPVQRRGIAYITEEHCLKFVHLEIQDVRLDVNDKETRAPSFRTDNWVVTTWTNKKMTNSFEDWDSDCHVEASGVTTDDPAVLQALKSGLLCRPQGDGDALIEEPTLTNLALSQPAPSLNNDHVVFLLARKKFRSPQAWILAVDVKNGKLKAVVELGDQSHYGPAIYCPSIISRHIDPMEMNVRPAEPVSFEMEPLEHSFLFSYDGPKIYIDLM